MHVRYFEIHRKILDDSTPFSKREKIDDAVNNIISAHDGYKILSFKHLPATASGADFVELWLIKEKNSADTGACVCGDSDPCIVPNSSFLVCSRCDLPIKKT